MGCSSSSLPISAKSSHQKNSRQALQNITHQNIKNNLLQNYIELKNSCPKSLNSTLKQPERFKFDLIGMTIDSIRSSIIFSEKNDDKIILFDFYKTSRIVSFFYGSQKLVSELSSFIAQVFSLKNSQIILYFNGKQMQLSHKIIKYTKQYYCIKITSEQFVLEEYKLKKSNHSQIQEMMQSRISINFENA